MNTIKKFRVSIFGESYSLVSDETDDIVNSAAYKVDTLMRTIAESSGISDSKRIAVLAALHIANECRMLENQMDTCNKKEQALVEHLDQELKNQDTA